jgi:hypothetical protein
MKTQKSAGKQTQRNEDSHFFPLSSSCSVKNNHSSVVGCMSNQPPGILQEKFTPICAFPLSVTILNNIKNKSEYSRM